MFVNDIRHGIGGTEVRAAFLKGVVEERGLTADQARVQAAICEAHQETRVPITVIANAAHQTGRLALDFYERHGVDLAKVVIGHAGDSNDLRLPQVDHGSGRDDRVRPVRPGHIQPDPRRYFSGVAS
jgi:phosphotriesterase-related protein